MTFSLKYIDGKSNVFKNGKLVTKEDMIEFLIEYSKKIRRFPVQNDFLSNHRYPNFNMYRAVFGSWSDAINQAGLYKTDFPNVYKKPRNRSKKYTEEELLEILRIFERENGRLPTVKDFTNNIKYPSVRTYVNYFGSWNNALEKAFDIKRRKYVRERTYSEEEMLEYLRISEREYGRLPTEKDFTNNSKYPSFATYQKTFGSWLNALIKAGLNVDLMGYQCRSHRARKSEIAILDYLENKPIDLSGKDRISYYDGFDLNDGPYDVKSSKLCNGDRYKFSTRNKDKDDNIEAIQWYYLVALNEDGSIRYVWKVPGEKVETDTFARQFTVNNMEEYDITDKLKLRIMKTNHKQALDDLENMKF